MSVMALSTVSTTGGTPATNCLAMKVISAEQHPNADVLRLYTMSAPEVEKVQVIANLDNIYQIDDVVAIALSGSVLKDGTKIKPSKLRGVYSYGMALGKVDVPVGTDLSETYCQPEGKLTATGIQFIKWTSIELLHNVRSNLAAIDLTPVITYRAKIKLHGTNAAVQVTTDGRVAAQKRTSVLRVFDPLNDSFKKRSQIITPQDDNAGFADWVSYNLDYFSQLKGDSNLTIFGEWCGSNIQKGVAVSQIKRKVFAVFAIQYGGVNGQLARLEIRPEKIRDILPEHEDIFVLPYYGEPVTLDFGNKERLQAATEQINSMVAAVEKVDPWVKETFGVMGTGEGLVVYPETDELVFREGYSELIFKAKGEKHRVVKNKQAVQIDPEVARSIEEFVDLFVTEARLEQALTEGCGGELNMRKMGQFLKWISLDIQKESEAELAAGNLTWKQVNKSLSTAARKWYENKVKQ